MPETRFWSLIDQSQSDNPDQQIEKLRASLSQLTADDVVAFEATFDELMQRSYRWDLWGAAYVAMGGASDDSFEYFRLWLIARGQNSFNQVLDDPDLLAGIAPSEPELMEFEDFAHVAPNVWASKTRQSWEEMPHLASFFNPVGYGSPAGEEFPEDAGELAKRYPKLWQRFGAGGHQNK